MKQNRDHLNDLYPSRPSELQWQIDPSEDVKARVIPIMKCSFVVRQNHRTDMNLRYGTITWIQGYMLQAIASRGAGASRGSKVW